MILSLVGTTLLTGGLISRHLTMNPVTGPFNKVFNLAGPPHQSGDIPIWFSRAQEWYRQREGNLVPLPYIMSAKAVLSNNKSLLVFRDVGNAPSLGHSNNAAVYSKCYGKLVEQLGDKSLWAVNIAEHKSALDSITKNSLVLVRAIKKLRVFNVHETAKVLKVAALPTYLKRRRNWEREFRTNRTKSLADLWLEFHFGWEPLVKDIGAAVDVLQNPPPFRRLRVRASDNSVFRNDSSPPFWNRHITVTKLKQEISVKVRPSQDNVYLANQLGFIDPVGIAWELVPFSFIADWFTNVGQFLSQYSDFLGVETSHAYETDYRVSEAHETSYTGLSVFYRSVFLTRTLGIGGPKFFVRPWKGFSPVRAITALSLLRQQMSKLR